MKRADLSDEMESGVREVSSDGPMVVLSTAALGRGLEENHDFRFG